MLTKKPTSGAHVIVFDAPALDDFLAADADGPVVMLNLLRFAPDGAAKYQAYAEQFSLTGINDRYGLEIVYAGVGGVPLVAESGQDWDMVALIRYPSRRHFVDMIHDPDYRRFEHLRREALVEAVLQPTTPLGHI
jgi:uncharacterized protein (DUF1330 family)